MCQSREADKLRDRDPRHRYQGQAIWFLASNPLGVLGTDLFGTADRAIDYGVIGATKSWYYQVGFVVLGHVAALILAHDRAIALYDQRRLAVRSQYWEPR